MPAPDKPQASKGFLRHARGRLIGGARSAFARCTSRSVRSGRVAVRSAAWRWNPWTSPPRRCRAPTLFGLYPFLLKLYADGGYQGPRFQQGLRRVCRQINVEIVKRSDAGTFVVLPKRWNVERTIGWLNRCRPLAKDWECLNRNGLAFLEWASVRVMVRKLCQSSL